MRAWGVRIATWNVNSVKSRLPRLLDWLQRSRPDVVCLQETKCTDGEFPVAELAALGYESAAHGDGRWNGVAVLSRVGVGDVVRGLPGAPGFPEPEARAISAVCGGVRVWSVYVPNGRSLDDPHYLYKLAWLERLRDVLAAEGPPLAVCGDMNIAPTDADVWDPSLFTTSTHVSLRERAALASLLELGLVDVTRARWPEERIYTYWDYRAGMFHNDKGMRIDLVLASPDLAGRLAAVHVDRAARKGTGPSDHAPLVFDIDTAPDGDIGPVVPPPSARRR